MKIVNFAERHSLISQYMAELRDVNVQADMLRFRTNLRRIGQIMAYEISRTLSYREKRIQTPLAEAEADVIDTKLVLATIFRAGVPFHQGFLTISTTRRTRSCRPTASTRRRRISMCA